MSSAPKYNHFWCRIGYLGSMATIGDSDHRLEAGEFRSRLTVRLNVEVAFTPVQQNDFKHSLPAFPIPSEDWNWTPGATRFVSLRSGRYLWCCISDSRIHNWLTERHIGPTYDSHVSIKELANTRDLLEPTSLYSM
jgi:hypothetical protein